MADRIDRLSDRITGEIMDQVIRPLTTERDALRSVVRRLRNGWHRDYTRNEWWRQLPDREIQAEPMTNAERSALMAAESDDA